MIAIASEEPLLAPVEVLRSERTGSLRPIGQIVGELLTSYNLSQPVEVAQPELALV